MEDVIIIGGGASGLRCGVEVAKRGKRCLILDQKEKAGKKLYATGNGKCNFANTDLSEDCYRLVASSPDSVWQVIHSDSWKQIAADFQAMGVPAVERQGYLYPRSEQAAAIVQALEQTYLAAGGRLQCQETVTKLCWKSDSCVQVLTDKESYTAEKIVLAVTVVGMLWQSRLVIPLPPVYLPYVVCNAGRQAGNSYREFGQREV